VFATAIAVLVVGAGEPGLAATQEHVLVDCGSGADLQAAIDAAPKRAVLEVSGTCRGTFSIGQTLVLRGNPAAAADTLTDQQHLRPRRRHRTRHS